MGVKTERQRREVTYQTYYPIARIENHMKTYSRARIGNHSAHAQAIVLEEIMSIVLSQAIENAKAEDRVTLNANDIALAIRFHFSDTFLESAIISRTSHREYAYLNDLDES